MLSQKNVNLCIKSIQKCKEKMELLYKEIEATKQNINKYKTNHVTFNKISSWLL